MKAQPLPPALLTGLILLAIAMLATGLPIDMMDVDATQYASISREMLQTGEFLQVLHRGEDYLDKPPLLFWTSALSFHLFGFANSAYKLCSFLAVLLGAFSVNRLVRLYYDRQSGLLAALIFLSSIAILLITNDVRTDTLLMGFTTFAVWQAAGYFKTRRLVFAAGFGIGIGLAMLSKGPIGLVVPASAVGWHLVRSRSWRRLADPGWLLSLALLIIVLLPMCWGLYQQYDMHPEKVIQGRTGVSGLRFFFWEQSFGRITGESAWKNDLGYLFFVQTFLWAFLPWITAFLWMLSSLVTGRWNKNKGGFGLKEGFTTGAFVIPFIALSLSHYKLPHYIYVVIPFAAAMTGAFLVWLSRQMKDAQLKTLNRVQLFICLACLAFFAWMTGFVFPENPLIPFLLFVLITGMAAFGWRKFRLPLARTVLLSLYAFCLAAIALNFVFYPNLLRYQAGSQAGKWAAEALPEGTAMYAFDDSPNSLDYYSGRYRIEIDDIDDLKKRVQYREEPLWIYTRREGMQRMIDAGFSPTVLFETPDYKVSMVSLKFLDPARRENACDSAYILQL